MAPWPFCGSPDFSRIDTPGVTSDDPRRFTYARRGHPLFALEANAVDSFKYLAVTRIIALMIAMPLLTLMMDFSGIFGGYVAEVAVSGMSWQLYFERAFTYISYSDLIPATLKTIVFGFLIAAAASFLGFTTSRPIRGRRS